jgi:hypothetical protein
MKRVFKNILWILIIASIISYVAYFVLWGVGMGKIENTPLSIEEKAFIKEFQKNNPQLEFSFTHNDKITTKTKNANIVIEPKNLRWDFKNWPQDSLHQFTNHLNVAFQKVLNHKYAYDSLHIIYINYENRIIYKDYSYSVDR